MPPLGDAVGLVDAEEGRLRALEQGCSGGQLERLGRRENDELAAFFEPLKRSPSLGRAQPAVKCNYRDAAPPESTFLIRHEGNAWRDNNGRPIKNHPTPANVWAIRRRLLLRQRQRHEFGRTSPNGFAWTSPA